MSRLILTLLTVVATCYQAAAGPNDAPWMDILVLDCNSKVHLLPSHPLFHSALDFTVGTNVYSYVVNTIKQRASCHCPSLTQAEIGQSFTADFGSVLRAWDNAVDNSTLRSKCGLQYSTDQAGLLWAQPLPTTCSYDRWTKGLPCNVQAPIPLFNMNAQISISQCPAGSPSKFPYVSVTCSGRTCKDLLVPCSVDKDCLGSRCTAIGRSTVSSINSALSSFFDVTGVIPKAEQDSCPSRWNNGTIGTVQLNDMMKALRSLMLPYAAPTDGLDVKFCGIDQFADADFSVFNSIPFSNPQHILSYLNSLPDTWGVRSFMQPFDWVFGGILDAIPKYLPWNIPRAILFDTLRFTWALFKPVWNSIGATFTQNSQNRVTWIGVREWDGLLDNQQYVNSTARLRGMAFPSIVTPPVEPLSPGTNFVPLLVTSCDMVVSVLPNQPVSITARLPDFQSVFQAAAYRERNAATCRGPTSDAQYRTFFDPLSLEFWQNLLTKTVGGPTINVPGLGYTTPSSLIASVLNNVSMIIPHSCSLSTWMSTDQCSGSYSGLNSLFSNLDLTLHWSINRCRAYPDALPSVNLQCVGQDCASFFNLNQVKACVQDTDCGTGGQCNLVSNSLLGTTGILNQFWYSQQDAVCESSNLDFLELMNYKNMFTKQPVQNYSNTRSIGYCNMVWQKYVATDLKRWVDSSYSLANKTVTITGLGEYVPPTATASSSTGSVQPSELPAGSKQITFNVDVPSSASVSFANDLLNDVAAALTLAFSSSQVGAEQLLPYLQFASMSNANATGSSRRLLEMNSYSYYIYGSVHEVSSESVTSAALASNFQAQVAAGTFDTPNSGAAVPQQVVRVEDVNPGNNGASSSIPQLFIFVVALVAAVIM